MMNSYTPLLRESSRCLRSSLVTMVVLCGCSAPMTGPASKPSPAPTGPAAPEATDAELHPGSDSAERGAIADENRPRDLDSGLAVEVLAEQVDPGENGEGEPASTFPEEPIPESTFDAPDPRAVDPPPAEVEEAGEVPSPPTGVADATDSESATPVAPGASPTLETPEWTELIGRIKELGARGESGQIIAALAAFLRDQPDHPHFDQQQHYTLLQQMLRHLYRSEAHLKADREVEAVKEFDKAARLVPVITDHMPAYPELRRKLIERLSAEGQAALESGSQEEVITAYSELAFLRRLADQEALRLGKAQQTRGYLESARTSLERIPPSAKEYAEARWTLALVERTERRFKAAKRELERAREGLKQNAALETDYADVCETLGNRDEALRAWYRIADWEEENPQPFVEISRLEAKAMRWTEVAKACQAAIDRSAKPRPDLALVLAEAHEKANQPEASVRAWARLLTYIEDGVDVPEALGQHPAKSVRDRIKAHGYVHHHGDWIPRDRFLEEQGWARHEGTWLRPEEVRFRKLVQRFESQGDGELRTEDAAYYRDQVKKRRLAIGMNRQEVVQSWGFFADQNVVTLDESAATYDQLLFARGKQAYLRNGVVCFWSE